MNVRSVLVPLDGSRFGEFALPHALGLARRAGAGLELVHVCEPSSWELSLGTPVRDPGEAAQEGRAYLADVEGRVRAAASAVGVSSTLLHGPVADALCERIRSSNTDLVVLTTHGRGPLSRFWLGGVATDLVRRCPAPLLLARPQEGPPDLAGDPAPRRVLIPLDGSPGGEAIIPPATAVGALTGAAYRLLRVVPPILTSRGGGPAPLSPGSRTVADGQASDARSYLTGLTTRWPALGAAETHVVVDWPPAGAILADADASAIDLIALVTRCRSDFVRLLMGSVVDKVVRGTTGPVLLHGPPAE